MRIWSCYFDKNESRKKGRKISKKQSFENVTIDQIYKAARILHLRPEIENKKYPRLWWKGTNSIKVESKWKKIDTIKRISTIMSKDTEPS